MVRRHELTDAQWRAIEPLLPANGRLRGQWSDHRMVVNGVLFRARTGVPLAGPAGAVRALADRLRTASALVGGRHLAAQPGRAADRGRCWRSRRRSGPRAGARVGGEHRLHFLPGPSARDRGPAPAAAGRGRGACGGRWTADAGTLTGRDDHQGPPAGRRPGPPADLAHLTGPAGRQSHAPAGAGDAAHSPPRARPATPSPGPGARRQGVLQPRQPRHPAPPGHQGNDRRAGRPAGRPPQPWPGRRPTAQYRRRSAVECCVSKWKQFRAVASRYDKRDYIFNGTSSSPRSSSGSATPSKSHQKRPRGVGGSLRGGEGGGSVIVGGSGSRPFGW